MLFYFEGESIMASDNSRSMTDPDVPMVEVAEERSSAMSDQQLLTTPELPQAGMEEKLQVENDTSNQPTVMLQEQVNSSNPCLVQDQEIPNNESLTVLESENASETARVTEIGHQVPDSKDMCQESDQVENRVNIKKYGGYIIGNREGGENKEQGNLDNKKEGFCTTKVMDVEGKTHTCMEVVEKSEAGQTISDNTTMEDEVCDVTEETNMQDHTWKVADDRQMEDEGVNDEAEDSEDMTSMLEMMGENWEVLDEATGSDQEDKPEVIVKQENHIGTLTWEKSMDHLIKEGSNQFPAEILNLKRRDEVIFKPGICCPVPECYLSETPIQKASFLEEHWNMYHYSKTWTVLCRLCQYKTTRSGFMVRHVQQEHAKYAKSRTDQPLHFEDAYNWWCKNLYFIDPKEKWIDFYKARKVRKEHLKVYWKNAFGRSKRPQQEHQRPSQHDELNKDTEENLVTKSIKMLIVDKENTYPPEAVAGKPEDEILFEPNMCCPVEGCSRAKTPCQKVENMETHWNSLHYSKCWICLCRYCDYKTVNNRKMMDHLHRSHGEISVSMKVSQLSVKDAFYWWCSNPVFIDPKGKWMNFKKDRQTMKKGSGMIQWERAFSACKRPANFEMRPNNHLDQMKKGLDYLLKGEMNQYPAELHKLLVKDEYVFISGQGCPVENCHRKKHQFKRKSALEEHWNLNHLVKCWAMVCNYCGWKETRRTVMLNHILDEHEDVCHTVEYSIQPKHADVTHWWCDNPKCIDPKGKWLRLSTKKDMLQGQSYFDWGDAFHGTKQPPGVEGNLRLVQTLDYNSDKDIYQASADICSDQDTKDKHDYIDKELTHLRIPKENAFPLEILRRKPEDEVEFTAGMLCPIKGCPFRSKVTYTRPGLLEEHWNLCHYSKCWVVTCYHCKFKTYRNIFMVNHLTLEHSEEMKEAVDGKPSCQDAYGKWCVNPRYKATDGKWMNFNKARSKSEDTMIIVPWGDAFKENKKPTLDESGKDISSEQLGSDQGESHAREEVPVLNLELYGPQEQEILRMGELTTYDPSGSGSLLQTTSPSRAVTQIPQNQSHRLPPKPCC